MTRWNLGTLLRRELCVAEFEGGGRAVVRRIEPGRPELRQAVDVATGRPGAEGYRGIVRDREIEGEALGNGEVDGKWSSRLRLVARERLLSFDWVGRNSRILFD